MNVIASRWPAEEREVQGHQPDRFNVHINRLIAFVVNDRDVLYLQIELLFLIFFFLKLHV